MSARVPLDVDLEDKLMYGLTPTRLAYMLIAMLVGFALWSSGWLPPLVRAVAAAACVLIGAGVSWGRWSGKAADEWIVDLVFFAARTRRLEWSWTSIGAPGPPAGEASLDVAEAEASAEAA